MLSNLESSAARSLLLCGLFMVGAASAQQPARGLPQSAHDMTTTATSNLPSGSGEASTMTNGVPNLLASNPQPGELGIQSRLTVRHAARTASPPSALNVMGGAPEDAGRGPTGVGAAVR